MPTRESVGAEALVVPWSFDNAGWIVRRRRHDRLDARTDQTSSGPSTPTCVAVRALPLFSDRLLEDRLIQAEVGNQALELAIFLAQLLELT
jgi:hypothetical protein